MKIRKRSGKMANLDIGNIRKQTIPATYGLKNVSYEELELAANISFQDGMESRDIQTILIDTAKLLVDVDKADYTYVAGRLICYDLYHDIRRRYGLGKQRGQVYDAITLAKYLEHSEDKLSYSIKGLDIEALEAAIVPERDELLTSLAMESLMHRYMLKINDEIVELPQHMFMSLAIFHATAEHPKDRTKWALRFYEVMSKLEYLPATPTLSNGRTLKGNCMSCAVGSTPDNLTGIFDAYSEQAEGSKAGTGFGWDWSRVRALGGIIGDTRGASGGLVPWLKIENDIAVAVDQLGVRKGAFAVYLETWHKDIHDFLDMKRNSGEDKRLAKELFLGVSCSDLFMKRVENEEDFTLFDPYDVRILTETFGYEFEKHYEKFEKQFQKDPDSFTNPPVVVNAKSLYKKIQKYYWETGMPFWFFKDTANIYHENQELGLIRSTNLCTEIFQAANEYKTILCNLGSINLSIVNTKEDMERVIPIAMRMLDNIVDLNYYAIPKSEENQKHTRAVGLGIAGEAEMIANMHIMYGSDEHLEFIKEFYRDFSEISDNASVDLGKERGTWCEDSEYRNGYRRAIAPTSSIGIIMGTSPCHEAVYNKVWIEDNKMGNFKITAPHINPSNYQYYINAYEVDQERAVRATAIRQKEFDQGISQNLFFRPGTSGKKVYDTIMLAWKLKLKSLYYLRSESAQLDEVANKTTKIACFGCEG